MVSCSQISSYKESCGWPEYIYSDPGSQLEPKGSSGNIGRRSSKQVIHEWCRKCFNIGICICRYPWHQGTVEALIKASKRPIAYAVSKQRLTVPKFLTVCTEAANLVNERPIGTLAWCDLAKQPTTRTFQQLRTPNDRPLTYSKHPITRYHLVQAAVETILER